MTKDEFLEKWILPLPSPLSNPKASKKILKLRKEFEYDLDELIKTARNEGWDDCSKAYES